MPNEQAPPSDARRGLFYKLRSRRLTLQRSGRAVQLQHDAYERGARTDRAHERQSRASSSLSTPQQARHSTPYRGSTGRSYRAVKRQIRPQSCGRNTPTTCAGCATSYAASHRAFVQHGRTSHATGAFAAWSQRVEATPGPLAATSRELARSAQIKAHTSKPKKVSMGSAGGAAMLLMQVASQGQGTMAEAILMRQLARLTVAIIDMHKAIGDEGRAAEISRTLNSQMATVASRLPEVPRKDQNSEPVDVDERTAEAVRIAQTGLSAPRPGSPVPTKIEPAKPYKPATGPEQDRGIGR